MRDANPSFDDLKPLLAEADTRGRQGAYEQARATTLPYQLPTDDEIFELPRVMFEPIFEWAGKPRRTDVGPGGICNVAWPEVRPDALVPGVVARKSLSLSKTEHNALVADVVPLIEAGRAAAARSVNSAMTTTYWHVGRVIVEREQRGARRAEYGAAVLERLAETLTARFGRGFSRRNIEQMRAFYLTWPIPQTASAISPARKAQTLAALSGARSFALPWSHYVRLLSVSNADGRAFYETGALRGEADREPAPTGNDVQKIVEFRVLVNKRHAADGWIADSTSARVTLVA